MTTITKKDSKKKTESKKEDIKYLILHNDDVNTFNFVIDCLIDICGHKKEQAEQCALITHYKGKCDIKKGTKTILIPLHEKLSSKGLSVTIE